MGLDVITIISALATILGVVGGMLLILLPQIRKVERQVTDTRKELKGDNVALRTELRAEMSMLRTELKGDVAALRTEVKTDIAALRTELKTDIAALREEVAGVRDELVVTRVAMTDRVARVEGRVFGLPLPEAAADTA